MLSRLGLGKLEQRTNSVIAALAKLDLELSQRSSSWVE